MEATLRTLARLTRMGPDEFRVRLFQEIAKRWDLVRYHVGTRLVCSNGQRFRSTGRFFFSAKEVPEIVRYIREQLPQTAAEIVDRAEGICKHKFDLLGYKDLDYGSEVDWHLDIVNGKRAPLRPWFKIRYLDFDEVGDSKIIWELSRHQHLVTLAKAYRLTQSEHFARELVEEWYHWREHNPYPLGINWASSLEVAFRSLSWVWICNLLQDCPVVPVRFFTDLRQALALNTKHILRFLSTYFSPNTHLLGEGVALFAIGTLYPELPLSQQSQERGWRIVLQEAERQVQSDGMHFEQSLYYHTYATDFCLHAWMLAKLNGLSVPISFQCTVEKMLEVLRCLGQTGIAPPFGDDDGGRVFDQQRNRVEHLLDPLATGAVLLQRSDFKAVAGSIREETVWLLGVEGAKSFESLDAREPRISSMVLGSSGIHMSASCEPEPWQLTIDAGPQGALRAGHGHADALSLQLHVGAKRVLIDPGTFSYTNVRGERDRFRGTAAHNTLRVDELDQAEPESLFGWWYQPRTVADRWVTGTTFDFFAGSHNGYTRLPGAAQHSRYVFHLKSRFWLVRDVVRGSGVHTLEIFWHIAPHMRVSEPERGILITDGDRPILSLVPAEDRSWDCEVAAACCSPTYGARQPCKTLRFSKTEFLPSEFALVLKPMVDAPANSGVLQSLVDVTDGGPVGAYVYSSAQVTDYMFFAEQSQPWKKGRCASDARFLLWEIDSTKNLTHLVICDGTYVEVDDRRVFESGRPMMRYERLASPSGNQVFCSDPGSLICEPESSSATRVPTEAEIFGPCRS